MSTFPGSTLRRARRQLRINTQQPRHDQAESYFRDFCRHAQMYDEEAIQASELAAKKAQRQQRRDDMNGNGDGAGAAQA